MGTVLMFMKLYLLGFVGSSSPTGEDSLQAEHEFPVGTHTKPVYLWSHSTTQKTQHLHKQHKQLQSCPPLCLIRLKVHQWEEQAYTPHGQ